MAALIMAALVRVTDAVAESPNDILVVVNTSSSVSATTLDELRNVFLKKKTAWRAGSAVTPVNASEGSPLRERFRKVVLGMTSTEEKEYWKNTKIQGGSTEPPAYNDTMKATFKLRSCVSYIFRSQYKEGLVKIVLVIPAN